MTNEEIFALMDRFSASAIQSMKVKREGFSLELSKAAPVQTAPVQAAPVQAAAPAAAGEEKREEGHFLRSSLVGTYYAAPAPDKEPFVQVGQTVKKGEPVCLIEAMKMMSEVPAPCDCVVEELLCQNGELVSFDAPILRYRPL